MKLLILSAFMLLSLPSYGSNQAICSLLFAHKLKKPILSLGKSDKFAHCALSCQLALRCGGGDSFSIGVLKEIWDVLTPGDADIEDLKADLAGIRFWSQKLAVDDRECVERCDEKY